MSDDAGKPSYADGTMGERLAEVSNEIDSKARERQGLPPVSPAEEIAMEFHAAYERLAPTYGYVTRKASAKPWGDVPEDNRRLMIAVAQDLLDREVIRDTQ